MGEPHVESKPTATLQTHFIEDTGFLQRAYLAICGASVHAKEMARRTSPEPTCPTCKRMLDEFDALEF